jgi:hypothetical protein
MDQEIVDDQFRDLLVAVGKQVCAGVWADE